MADRSFRPQTCRDTNGSANHRARRFYERYGFEEIGVYTFMVGDHADEDHLMRLAL